MFKRLAPGLTLLLLIFLLSGMPVFAQGQGQSNLCATNVDILNGQGRFTLSGLGRFTLSGLEGPNGVLDPSDNIPQALLDEINNNPIDDSWLEGFLTPFISNDIYAAPQLTAILIVDDFPDRTVPVANLPGGQMPTNWSNQMQQVYGSSFSVSNLRVMTHGQMVREVVMDQIRKLRQYAIVPSIASLATHLRVVNVDISRNGEYRLDLVVPQITQTITNLQSQGIQSFVINMSFGLIPCTTPQSGNYPAFDIDNFLTAREAANEWVFDVDAKLTNENDVQLPEPVIYNSYGLTTYLMRTHTYTEQQATEYINHLFNEVNEIILPDAIGRGVDPAVSDPAIVALSTLLQGYLNTSRTSNGGVIIPIAASGNYADYFPSGPLEPAALPQVIAVGATMGMGTTEWAYSQPAHILAPGAWYDLNRADAYVAGTSFAAPHVSMIAAIYAAYPGACTFSVNGLGDTLPPLVNQSYVETVLKPNVNPFTCSLPRQTDLFVNSSFEIDVDPVDNLADRWGGFNLTGDQRLCGGGARVMTGTCAFLFRGSPTDDNRIQHRVDLTQWSFAQGDRVVVNGYAWSTGLPNFRIRLVANYADGTADVAQVRYNVAGPYSRLPTLEMVFSQANPIQVRLLIMNRTTTGRVFFDEMSMHKNPPSAARSSQDLIPMP
ncbi:MAG: S8/S53 family peptidase [Anaerolineae bacterium]|jgi:hypothetical protein|nr:S8/S53 family peptidase [Anaerolineae bacterium]